MLPEFKNGGPGRVRTGDLFHAMEAPPNQNKSYLLNPNELTDNPHGPDMATWPRNGSGPGSPPSKGGRPRNQQSLHVSRLKGTNVWTGFWYIYSGAKRIKRQRCIGNAWEMNKEEALRQHAAWVAQNVPANGQRVASKPPEGVDVQQPLRSGLAIKVRDRFTVLRRDSFRCRYCGRGPEEIELEIDHFVPVTAGGKSEVGNLITACRDCNYGKGSTLLPQEPHHG